MPPLNAHTPTASVTPDYVGRSAHVEPARAASAILALAALAPGPVDEPSAVPGERFEPGIDTASRRDRGEYTPDADRFRRLVDEWYRTRPRGDVREMCMHPAYLAIIGMGRRAVPLILRELEQRPGHWFCALHAITGLDDVVPEHAKGRVKEMAAAWVRWGRDHGLL